MYNKFCIKKKDLKFMDKLKKDLFKINSKLRRVAFGLKPVLIIHQHCVQYPKVAFTYPQREENGLARTHCSNLFLDILKFLEMAAHGGGSCMNFLINI
uniref:Uncharacterized protein n=1 Tax=Glossina brevipalpis TaxID=37001 RepID=A0A1A9X1I2_9MUSC